MSVLSNFKFQTKHGIRALSLSPSHEMVVVAGRDVLRVLSIKRNVLASHCNLRAGIRRNLNISCNDVQWHPRKDLILATAATNGTITLWNLERRTSSKKTSDFNKGKRAVNRLSWSHDHEHYLLSGAQESTVKLWDIRSNKNFQTFKHRRARAAHEVVFQPNCADNSSRFAVGLDNGSIAIWDCRSNKEPVVEWKNAHHGIVLTLDWHPTEPAVLASGGRDCMIKVWDSSKDGSRSSVTSSAVPRYRLRTTATVGRVKWRPGSQHEIASVANVFDCDVRLWNLERPNYPMAIFRGHRDAASCIRWISSDRQPSKTLISCSKDGTVILHTIERAFVSLRHMKSTSLTFGPKGNVAFVSGRIDRERVARAVISGTLSSTLARGDTVLEPSNISAHVVPSRSWLDGSEFAQPFVWCEATIRLATRYRIHSMSALDLCRHNARVAAEAGCDDAESTWRFLVELLHLDDDDDDNDDAGTRDEQRCSVLDDFRYRVIADIIRSAAERDDVQTATVLLLCIGSGVDGKRWETFWSPRLQQQWLAAYVDILQRANLEVEAAEIRRYCGDPDISGMTRRDTLMTLRCGRCQVMVVDGKERRTCASCEAPLNPTCSLCCLPVQGLGLWCSVCGHGGHLEHIRSWFSDGNTACPSGCGHKCRKTLRLGRP